MSRPKTRTLAYGSTVPEWRVWAQMIQRCTNPKTRTFAYYGGRGITVCARWRSSYESFVADMGTRPSLAYTLDRVDNNGHYEPGNCRWATRAEQAMNTRRNRLLTHGGETKPLTAWARQYGIHPVILHKRIGAGWLLAKALTLPPFSRGNRSGLKGAGSTRKE